MPPAMSTYEWIESNPRRRPDLHRYELILDVTEAIARVMNQEKISYSDLARRLRRPKKYVSTFLGTFRNLTLGEISTVFDALGYRPRVIAEKSQPRSRPATRKGTRTQIRRSAARRSARSR